MLHWITILSFAALAYSAAVENPLAQGEISEISQSILESKIRVPDSSILHRVPRAHHHHRHSTEEDTREHGRSHGYGHASGSQHQGRRLIAGRGVQGQAGRGNVFNWDINASSGKQKKKTPQRLSTKDASIENGAVQPVNLPEFK